MTREKKKAILKKEYTDEIDAVIVSVGLMSKVLDLEDPEFGSLFLEIVLDELAEMKAKKERVNDAF